MTENEIVDAQIVAIEYMADVLMNEIKALSKTESKRPTYA